MAMGVDTKKVWGCGGCQTGSYSGYGEGAKSVGGEGWIKQINT